MQSLVTLVNILTTRTLGPCLVLPPSNTVTPATGSIVSTWEKIFGNSCYSHKSITNTQVGLGNTVLRCVSTSEELVMTCIVVSISLSSTYVH